MDHSSRPTSSFLASLRCALRGIVRVVQTQRNARIHLGCTLLVILVGLVLKCDRSDWLWLALAMALVWISEIFNSAIEVLSDRVTREEDPLIRDAKDMAAGAVTVAAIFAVVVAMLIFGSRLMGSASG